jgi:hypothetical protein
LAALTLAVTGCGTDDTYVGVPVVPVEGTVTFRGKPVKGALVALHPLGAAHRAAAPNPRATVQDDGRFRLSTYTHDDGAPEGDYVVTVQWFRTVNRLGDMGPGPNVLPPKYAKPESSDITVTVMAGANQLPTIALR